MEALPFAWPGLATGAAMPNLGMPDPTQWLKTLTGSLPAATGVSGTGDAAPFKIDPARLVELQNEYGRDLATLWSDWMQGRQTKRADKRFGTESWTGPHALLRGPVPAQRAIHLRARRRGRR